MAIPSDPRRRSVYFGRVLVELAHSLKPGSDMAPADIELAVGALLDPAVSTEHKAEFLTALSEKGESPAEIAAFAQHLKRHSRPVASRNGVELLDVCGTGGDRLNTFNISTTVAIVCAAAGVTVAKHGNRAITSQSGSADVLEALGVRVDLSAEEAVDWLGEHRFAFFFAPHFHPGFRHIGPARRLCADRGIRTIFNILGPLLNPAGPTVQLVGISVPHLTGAMSEALKLLGLRRAMVVSGQVPSENGPAWLDEFSTLGPTHISEFYQDRGMSSSVWSVEGFPIRPATLAELAGGDRAVNAVIIERILRGEEAGPKLDAVLLNAGAALMVAGAARSILEGWNLAAEAIASGAAHGKLTELRDASSRRVGASSHRG